MKKWPKLSLYFFLLLLFVDACDGILPSTEKYIKEIHIKNLEMVNNFYMLGQNGSTIIPYQGDFTLNFKVEQKYDDDLYIDPIYEDCICPRQSASSPPVLEPLDYLIVYDKEISLGNAHCIITVTPAWMDIPMPIQEKRICLKNIQEDFDEIWDIIIPYNDLPKCPYYVYQDGALSAKVRIIGRKR